MERNHVTVSLCIYSVPVRRAQCCVICLSAGRFFSATVSPKPLVQTSTKFSVRGRDWVHLWRRCNALCTSGFVDDVIFAVNGLYGAGDVGVSSK